MDDQRMVDLLTRPIKVRKRYHELFKEKNYAGPDIVAEMDWVTICGIRVARPKHITRSQWLAYWESKRWII